MEIISNPNSGLQEEIIMGKPTDKNELEVETGKIIEIIKTKEKLTELRNLIGSENGDTEKEIEKRYDELNNNAEANYVYGFYCFSKRKFIEGARYFQKSLKLGDKFKNDISAIIDILLISQIRAGKEVYLDEKMMEIALLLKDIVIETINIESVDFSVEERMNINKFLNYLNKK